MNTFNSTISTPDRDNLNCDRPKTSRGKQHPSPDEFASYVVPSPRAIVSQEHNEKFVYQVHDNQV
jgi:hypothetical protein